MTAKTSQLKNREQENDPQQEQASNAHRQADADIENDPDLSVSSPNDDLDEGELARLGENNNPIE